jgi:predicted transcriptional regulator
VNQPALANAELAVMDLLWRTDDRMTARQIREPLYPDASKAQHGAVQRLLQHLEDKGYVERDRTIAVHFFSAAISRPTFAGQQLESLADKLTAGSFAPLITHLVEEKKISRDEIKQIRPILDGQEGKGVQARLLREFTSEAVPRTDASYRSVAATGSPINLRSVPVAENLTHL